MARASRARARARFGVAARAWLGHWSSASKREAAQRAKGKQINKQKKALRPSLKANKKLGEAPRPSLNKTPCVSARRANDQRANEAALASGGWRLLYTLYLSGSTPPPPSPSPSRLNAVRLAPISYSKADGAAGYRLLGLPPQPRCICLAPAPVRSTRARRMPCCCCCCCCCCCVWPQEEVISHKAQGPRRAHHCLCNFCCARSGWGPLGRAHPRAPSPRFYDVQTAANEAASD
jgi:hypothetical protein